MIHTGSSRIGFVARQCCSGGLQEASDPESRTKVFVNFSALFSYSLGIVVQVGVWVGGCCGTWMHGGGWVAGKWLVGGWVDGLVGVWEDGCIEVNSFPLLYIQTPDQPPQRPLC